MPVRKFASFWNQWLTSPDVCSTLNINTESKNTSKKKNSAQISCDIDVWIWFTFCTNESIDASASEIYPSIMVKCVNIFVLRNELGICITQEGIQVEWRLPAVRQSVLHSEQVWICPRLAGACRGGGAWWRPCMWWHHYPPIDRIADWRIDGAQNITLDTNSLLDFQNFEVFFEIQ